MASLIIKLPLLDLELFIHMHTLLWNMPIHHTHVYDEYHSHIGSSLRQNFMRKLYNNCVISSLWAHPIILFYFLTKSDSLANQISSYTIIFFFWRPFLSNKCNKDNIAIQPFPRFDPLFANPLFVRDMVFNERLTFNISLWLG
jgi:hypothetical protein